jgi:aminoglycoside phosphotransferase family enzyme/predicted kinase
MPRQRRPQDLAGSDREEAEVIAFLSDPASYPGRPGQVDIVETHAARIFLAGRQALKIKKRVTLPFLDFSTLPKRRAALERELELNRDHAPEIYGGVSAISRGPDGRLTFGEGTVVDYALVMNRFEQENLLARIAAEGPLQPKIARELADMVARYHRTVPLAGGTSGGAVMLDTVGQLAASLTDAAPPSLSALMTTFAERSLTELARIAPLLEARGEAGHVRRCHGDLHLGNIVLLEGRVVPFDALEFDERLASIDVLYDLAFLLMDLDVRGDRRAANTVLNAYVSAEPTGSEIEGLATLPLFLAIRAAVRALVSLESALQKPEGEDKADTARAARYVTAANAYLAPGQPVLLAVGGLSGTGKSTLAAALAPRIGPAPGALVLRTDVERKRMFEVPETERLAVEHYGEQASDDVYAVLYAKTERALAAGHAVIFDGVSAKPAEREKISAIAAKLGVPLTGLWLDAPLEIQITRVEARKGDASDSNEAVVRAQAERDLGPITWTRIDAGQSPEHTFQQALAVLGLPQP